MDLKYDPFTVFLVSAGTSPGALSTRDLVLKQRELHPLLAERLLAQASFDAVPGHPMICGPRRVLFTSLDA